MEHRSTLVLLMCCGLASMAQAQEARRTTAEPHVKRIVIEDEGARIDELRVRGVTKRITVTPKTAGKVAYEIIPPDPSRDEPFSAKSGSGGASGQRVWNVLNF
jgi:hypothetical protein